MTSESVVGVGVDLVDIGRFGAVMERQPSLMERVFSEAERSYCQQYSNPAVRYAARFAAKEATLKALGLGLGGMRMAEIEVLREYGEPPQLRLGDSASRVAADRGVSRLSVSLAHTAQVAQATVTAFGTKPVEGTLGEKGSGEIGVLGSGSTGRVSSGLPLTLGGPSLMGDIKTADFTVPESLPESLPFPVDDNCELITDAHIAPLPTGDQRTHKWDSAVVVVAGSAGMEGAAYLTCAAAMRSGARMVHLSAPDNVYKPLEVVRSDPPLNVDPSRFHVCAVGPGLGRDAQAQDRLLSALKLDLPTVIDADALSLLDATDEIAQAMSYRIKRGIPTVVTPHAGEFEALLGQPLDEGDPVGQARTLVGAIGCVVLLKGWPTVVASPNGKAKVVTSGSARLATAGTGDVLTGMIAGRLAAFNSLQDVSRLGSDGLASNGLNGDDATLEIASSAAHLHAKAALAVPNIRLVASDLLGVLPAITP